MAENATTPESEARAALAAKKLVVRLSIALLFLLLGMAWAAWRFPDDDPAADALAIAALQERCLAGGLSSDSAGNCYAIDPTNLTEAERAAAVVPPQPASAPPPSADGGPADPRPDSIDVGRRSPDPLRGETILVVPSGTGTAAGSPTSGGATDPDTPADPRTGAAGQPVAPVAPVDPATPAAPAPVSGTVNDPDAAGSGSGGGAPNPVTIRETIRITLPLNFDPDPFPKVLPITGGAADVGQNAQNCDGWASSNPDIVLTYVDQAGSQAGSSGLPLRIFFESIPGGADTTLVVNDPYGQWWCNDNGLSGAVDPVLTFLDAGYGVYDIWIGAKQRGDGPNGAVYITERPLNPAN